jgi:NAD(P)-dependent dehydrogenase (short-subunit alcohol dehydrogenase family)
VAVVARTVDAHDHLAGSLTETLARCRRHGARVLAIAADLADADSRAAIVPRALELFDGRIDVLVNNAAAAIYQATVELPLKRRRITFEVNVHAPADLAQAVLPGMAARGEGWIVNVSSASARYELGRPKELRQPPPFIGVYGASKAALNRMTAAFAAELLGSGIRVNTVEPRAAVMSEGAEALVGGTLSPDLIESMEAMVEGALVLCDCPADWTGGVHVSLDLLDTLGRTVMTLDGRRPYRWGSARGLEAGRLRLHLSGSPSRRARGSRSKIRWMRSRCEPLRVSCSSLLSNHQSSPSRIQTSSSPERIQLPALRRMRW